MSSIPNKIFLQHVANCGDATQISTRSFETSRDYYQQLFSEDSDDTELNLRWAVEKLHTQEDKSGIECEIPGAPLSDMEKYETKTDIEFGTNVYIQDIHKVDKEASEMESQSVNSNMSITATYLSTENEEELSDLESLGMSSIHSSKSYDSIQFLTEDEIQKCFKGDILDVESHAEWERELRKEQQAQAEVDTIATFNIQNKYDHILAAEMMIKNQFTFIALQEPYASHHNPKQNWKNFQKKELASARISVFETPLQIIMYDNWKWGGKVISEFQSAQGGRVTSIAFGFKQNQNLGIISLYGITNYIGKDETKVRDHNNTRNTTTFLVKRICQEWKHKFPGIAIMIMGDLQETLTTEDSDNIGTYRKELFRNGILKSTQYTHTSIVRNNMKDKPYITRLGSKGGRGIDHILIPSNPKFQDWFGGGEVDRNRSANFFPSDHALLSCSFVRNGKNNRSSSGQSNAYEYKKLFQIKMKRSGLDGEDLVIDDSQFKDTRAYKKQADRLSKLREVTRDDSDDTNHYLESIEKRIQNLFQSLWREGNLQESVGENNKLIRISERQALSLSYATQSFHESVNAIMTKMKLETEKDVIGQGATIRKKLNDGTGFKRFQNLPIPTKLRYLNKSLKHSARKLRHMVHQIQRWQLMQGSPAKMEEDKFSFENLQILMDSGKLLKDAETIHRDYLLEAEERANHVAAIKYHTCKYKLEQHQDGSTTIAAAADKDQDGNMLKLNENLVKLINAWLAEGGCKQAFNKNKTQDKFKFLDKEGMDKWKHHLLHWDELTIDVNNNAIRMAMIKDLNSAIEHLDKLQNSTKLAQCDYKVQTLNFFIKTNKIESFTNKILPKDREAPIPHSEIWDKDIKNFRTCRNEVEEMIATGQHHNRWMSPSRAKESCAFVEVIREGNLGPRGVKLKPERKIGIDDIPNLIKDGQKLPKEMIRSFIEAHGSHTAALFREPERDHREFFYPFFLTAASGEMHEEKHLKEQYLNAISRVPGKARQAGFQMAVIGRYGRRWRRVLYNLIKLMLIMRYVPPCLKKISRFPIPKPGRTGEYRPISLCHDVYCFLNGVSTRIISKAIERAGILHEGIASYREGMGCVTLVGVEQAFREDCIESGIPASQVDEDEEKFFDRIPLEIILAAMRTCGFPTQGFLEMKANCMDDKYVEIITNKGNARATFSCGLEQGNPDSPTVANLVILLKHRIWNLVCEEFLENRKGIKEKMHCYTFEISDEQDGTVVIKMIGYCDDNSRFLSLVNEKDLIELTKKYLKLTGDLSLVTKIGRKGSKSEIHFYNLSAKLAASLSEWETIAWSFSTDSPMKEKVPFKLSLQEKQEKELLSLINLNPKLSEEDKLVWKERIHPAAHKHLGLTSTLKGQTTGTRLKVINKIKKRIAHIHSQRMGQDAQRLCNNMLCTTIHSFAPLQSNHDSSQLIECDNLVIKMLRRRKGLSTTDAAHRFWLDESSGGFGFKSFLEEDLIAVAREIEVVLNGKDIDSKALRGRLKALRINPNSNYCNHVKQAVHKLAKYGIYLRDEKSELVNFVLSNISRTYKYAPVGNAGYNEGNKATIGVGKKHLLDLAIGGTVEKIVGKILKGADRETIKTEFPEKLPVSFDKIVRHIKTAKYQRFQEATQMYRIWEWRYSKQNPTPPSQLNKWERMDASKHIMEKFSNSSYLELTTEEITKECDEFMRIDLNILDYQKSPDKDKTKYMEIAKYLFDSQSPLLIATDGSHVSKLPRTSATTTAAFVACKLKINPNASIYDADWEKDGIEPLIARILELPNQIGTERSDIAHGEATAVWLQEVSFPGDLARGIITDSAAIRDCLMKVRDGANTQHLDRNYIRKLSPGVSKCIVGKFRQVYGKNLEHTLGYEMRENQDGQKKVTISPIRKVCRDSLKLRLKAFVDISETWIENTNIIDAGKQNWNDSEDIENGFWPRKYWDNHEYRPFIKINSHQLDESGLQQCNNRRYKNISPKLAPLNANHWADVCAGLPNARINRNQEKTGADHAESRILLPGSNQRFFLTWGGATIDRNIAQRLRHIFQLEIRKRLRSKSTQGMMWRHMPRMHTSWNKVQQHKGWLRFLLGFCNSHTRSLYKSEIYRNGNWLEHHTSISLAKATHSGKINEAQRCNWCQRQKNLSVGAYGYPVKGNRMHHLFFCQHKKLMEFRNNVSKLIEQHLQRLVAMMITRQGKNATGLFLQEVVSTLEELERSNEGRLKKPPENWSNMPDFQREEASEDGQSIVNTIEKGTISYSTLFGMTPVMGEDGLCDDFLGTKDAIMWGLIPKPLNTVVKKACIVKHTGIPASTEKDMSQEMADIWEKVQELLIARTGGMHRLIGSISTEKESEWKKQYKEKLLIQGFKGAKKRNCNQLKRKISTISGAKCKEANLSTSTIKQEIPPTLNKLCTGSTCRPLSHSSPVKLHQMPNRIPQGKLQCQRCSKSQSATKSGYKKIEKMLEQAPDRQCAIAREMDNQSSNSPNFVSLMNMLEDNTTAQNYNKAKFKSKKRKIKDQEKNICKIILNENQSGDNKDQSGAEKLGRIAKGLKRKHQENIDILQKDIIHERKILASIINIDSVQGTNETNSQKGRDNISEKQRYALMSTRWQLFSGNDLDREIQAIRSAAPAGIYLADQDAAFLIQSFNLTDDWPRFGRMFRSNGVRSSKPPGIYLIPIFWGNHRNGHWTLIMIWRNGRRNKGYHFDSIGKSNTKGITFDKIKRAFTGKRDRFSWIATQSLPQQETECGFRTIEAIRSICDGRAAGMNVEECAIKASMMDVDVSTYCSMRIRKRVADRWLVAQGQRTQQG